LPGLRARVKTKAAANWFGFGAILLWSALPLLTAASSTMPPFQMTAVTFAIGGLCGLGVLAARGEIAQLRQGWQAWGVGAGGLFLYHVLYFAALRSAPPAEASLVNHLWPLLIVLFSALLPGEHLALRHIIGAFVSFGGLIALFSAKEVSLSGIQSGHVLALAAAFTWAAYSLLSRRLIHVPSGAVAGFCLGTALLAALVHLAVEETIWPRSASEWIAIVGLGLGPVGAAFFLWDHGVKHGDIRLIGTLAYAAPVLATIWLVLAGFAEANLSLALACVMIVGGAFIASRETR
jgi:drug/metabolite transporter (DMT)-like permease